MQHFTISALGELLLESIPIHFPDRGLILRRDSLAIVTIPSIHPEIGNVEIHDEINFLSVQLLDFTYVEICNYDKKISLRKRHQKIVDETIGMLIHSLYRPLFIHGNGRFIKTILDESLDS